LLIALAVECRCHSEHREKTQAILSKKSERRRTPWNKWHCRHKPDVIYTQTMTRFLIVPMLMLAARAWAGDVLPVLTTVNAAGTPVELRDVRIVKVEVDGVRVMHSSGTAKVPFERLPDDLQLKYGVDASKAYQHRDEAKAGAGATAPVLASSSKPATATQGSGARLVTKEDIKAAWLADCQQCFICPSDPQGAAKRQALAQREAAIRSGAWDGTAEQYAQQANARAAAKAGK
jgi:hypothetical protein